MNALTIAVVVAAVLALSIAVATTIKLAQLWKSVGMIIENVLPPLVNDYQNRKAAVEREARIRANQDELDDERQSW